MLDVLVQRRRDKHVACKVMRKLIRKQGFAPAVMTTDKVAFTRLHGHCYAADAAAWNAASFCSGVR